MACWAQITMGLGHVSPGALGTVVSRVTGSSNVRIVVAIAEETRSAIKALIHRTSSSAVTESPRRTCGWGFSSF